MDAATKFVFEPNAILPNGAKVVDCAYCSGLGYWVVVANWEGHHMPWVRWCCDSKGNCNWGRYCSTYEEAKKLWLDKLAQ